MKQHAIRFSTELTISSLNWCLAACVVGFGSPCFADTNFTVPTSTLSSGGKATSTNYSDEATVGDIVGVSAGTSVGVTLKSGFIGQLEEVLNPTGSSLTETTL